MNQTQNYNTGGVPLCLVQTPPPQKKKNSHCTLSNRDIVQKRQNKSGVYVCMVPSHSGTFLAVGAVVQVHSQLACLDMSVNLSLPVVDQRGRTDDQGAFRNHQARVLDDQQTNRN